MTLPPTALPASHWADCPECGLLQLLPAPQPRHSRHCQRCNCSFGPGLALGDAAPALALTALVLLLLTDVSPLMAIEVGGRGQSVRLGSGVLGLASHDLLPLALFVLLISILAPVGRVLALCAVLLQLRRDTVSDHPRTLVWLLGLADRLRPWAMLDVFLVGALIALTKLHDLASVEIGIGFWSLGLLVAVLASVDMAVDRRALWDRVSPPPPATAVTPTADWLGCRDCGLVQPAAARCQRCRQPLHRRKPHSVSRAMALVLTGFILYLPANLYPVLTIISFGRGAPATILGGVIELLHGNDWPLAVIVFAASVLVPLLKLLGLTWLLWSIRRRQTGQLLDRTRLFRLIELVSRWSTVDIVVAALLTALVTLGNLARIEPGLGVLAFGAVVLVTLLATECFDCRLLWDAAGANDG